MSFQVELNDRAARQALDAITRHATTIAVGEAVLARCREAVQASQIRLGETIEAILAARDIPLPKDYQVQLDGLTLVVHSTADLGPPAPQDSAPVALPVHANGSTP